MSKKLIIIIPAFNEEESIVEVINRIPILNDFDKEIIVIDDGSSDNTVLEARKTNAMIFSNKKNLGLGRTFKIGLEHAVNRGADIIVNLDADGQYDAKQITLLLKILIQENANLVMGNRFLDDRILGHSLIRRVGNKVISIFISKVLLRQAEIFDIQSGFRVLDRGLAKFLIKRLEGKYTYTQEMMILTILFHFKVKQIPIKFYKRSSGKSRLIKSPLIYLIKILWITFNTYARVKLGALRESKNE